ncbi:MAG TPA: carbon starvation CstA family protein, partial [Phycisphaerae bacterium]
MPSFLNNGATIILVSLLILAIAYRFYSAFLAAKVLALSPSATTPAHTLNDGQNYHPTNKWVLFGHHFAAISGAGPLIGPVLAAQFGYMPGLLWILIGVCLAGAVQDFIILTLSTRRNGKSLAQIAFSEIGPASGAAATIGILFVIVIALAGLGKVVTKALGGERVLYPEKTQFLATDAGPIASQGNSGGDYLYKIPAGTSIVYPGGGTVQVASPFVLFAEVHSGDPVDIEDSTVSPGEKLTVRLGGEIVTADTPEKTVYPAGTVFTAVGK